ncbi:unnamed protein product [Schistosoma margrebowiei]|uniref:Glutamate--cysteine ligase n=1 Tax=Schistosoma margrebowiei TaxID=48269 RepID=A0A3P8C7D2_9TREM|nr:unnamed protein product [Schistosoma margrebowiei]
MIRHYVQETGGHLETIDLINSYLDLIQKRASGELMTTAKWMRSRIMKHPDYKNDSCISSQINSDIIKECWDITKGVIRPPELLPHDSVTVNCSSLPCKLMKNFSGCNESIKYTVVDHNNDH